MTNPVPHPHAQSKYQVRFDWARDGAARVAADADVVIWVDVLGPAADAGLDDVAPAAELLLGGGADAMLVAEHVLETQVALGRRAFIAVIAAGEAGGSGSPRFAVEDLLGAGAVIDALAAVGLDYSSPEAAAACAAYTGLRGAVTHLATASASGQALLAAGVPAADIRAAAGARPAESVRVLRAYPA
ncbi:MAG: 2-phosphosulfolactate phosphatase [Leifsonia sp.]